MVTFRNILVVHRAGARFEAPLTSAIRIAAKHGARLTVAEIVRETGIQQFFSSDEALRDRRALTRKRVNARRAAAIEAGLSTVPLVLEGNPASAIVRAVTDRRHDLVVLGKRCQPSLGETVDATLLQVVRDCPCPVWVVKSTGAYRPRRIAAAIGCADPQRPLDELDRRVLALAASFARVEGGRLDILRPWDFRGVDHERSRSELLPEMFAEMLARNQEARAAGVDRLLLKTGLDGVSGEVHLLRASAERAVSRFVRQHGVDLLVTGSTAGEENERFLPLDPAEGILVRTRCSTITLKGPGFVPHLAATTDRTQRLAAGYRQLIETVSGTLSKRMR